MIVYLNGEYCEEADARVSIFDRGFLYGDTIYETVRTREGRILFWPEHDRRLRRSSTLAGFEIDWARVDLAGVLAELGRRNRISEGRGRITISRGTGDPDQLEGFEPTWVVTLRPYSPPPEERYEEGVAAVLVGIHRNPVRSLNPEMKSGNFLNNILARREARMRGAFEGIMLNPRGFVAEGAMCNIFWLHEGVLETPALRVGLLHGVTRAKILALARAAAGSQPSQEAQAAASEGAGPTALPEWNPVEKNLPAEPIPGLAAVREVEAPPERLLEAQEIFLSSTSLEALPVTRWEGRPVGSGRRGPVALELRRRLCALYAT